MNELNKVMYINLDFQPERNFYMRAMLTGMDCPLDSIIRFPAKAGKNYPDKQSICRAAAADGFPFFERIWEKTWMTLPCLGLQWSWCAALRVIAAGEDITLLMIDDYTLRKEWWAFRGLVGCIDEDLKILQVSQWYPHFEDNGRLGKLVSPRFIRHYNELLNYGFNGAGDGLIIYSPAGAEMMLQWLSEDPYFLPEIQVYLKSQTEIEGCFSVKFPYVWSGVVDRSVFEQATLSLD